MLDQRKGHTKTEPAHTLTGTSVPDDDVAPAWPRSRAERPFFFPLWLPAGLSDLAADFVGPGFEVLGFLLLGDLGGLAGPVVKETWRDLASDFVGPGFEILGFLVLGTFAGLELDLLVAAVDADLAASAEAPTRTLFREDGGDDLAASAEAASLPLFRPPLPNFEANFPDGLRVDAGAGRDVALARSASTAGAATSASASFSPPELWILRKESRSPPKRVNLW